MFNEFLYFAQEAEIIHNKNLKMVKINVKTTACLKVRVFEATNITARNICCLTAFVKPLNYYCISFFLRKIKVFAF